MTQVGPEKLWECKRELKGGLKEETEQAALQRGEEALEGAESRSNGTADGN